MLLQQSNVAAPQRGGSCCKLYSTSPAKAPRQATPKLHVLQYIDRTERQARKLRITAKSLPYTLGIRRRAQGTTGMLCASRDAFLCVHTCQHLQQLCYLLPTADLSGHSGCP